jgi:ProP effector
MNVPETQTESSADSPAAAQSTPPASSKSEAVQAARNLLKDLEARFAVFREVSPLAIGIDKQIIAAMPEVEKKYLRIALRNHTISTRYLKAMEKATVRRNLDGTEADAVNDEMRLHAATLLRERFKKNAEQKRAIEEAAKAEKIRAEKLNQLTEKFGRKSR